MENNFISHDQMQAILDNRPKGVSMDDVINGYRKNGYKIEGIDQPTQTVTDKIKDFGIGFVKGAGRTALDVGQNIQTIGQGALLAGGIPPESVAKTGIQSLDINSPQGKSLEQTLQPTNETQKLGGYAETGAEILAGGGAQALKTGIKKGSEMLLPKIAESVQSATNLGKTGTKVIKEVLPTTERIISHQVAQALDLTAGDIKNISQSTGNEVGRFLADKNLIGGNKDETAKLVGDFFSKNYQKVRSEIDNVKELYKVSQVPGYTDSLKQIKKVIDGVPGLEKDATTVDNLLAVAKNGGEVQLNDVQKAKELLDEHFTLYKATGDVKEGATKKGLANLRDKLKTFIEKKVKDNTGADIKSLNNDVSTSRSILDAIETRSTSGLTSSNIKLGDLGIFGAGMSFGGPLGGAAAVFGKKILESSAIRLKIARYLDKLQDAKKIKIQKELLNGVVPKELENIANQ